MKFIDWYNKISKDCKYRGLGEDEVMYCCVPPDSPGAKIPRCSIMNCYKLTIDERKTIPGNVFVDDERVEMQKLNWICRTCGSSYRWDRTKCPICENLTLVTTGG